MIDIVLNNIAYEKNCLERPKDSIQDHKFKNFLEEKPQVSSELKQENPLVAENEVNPITQKNKSEDNIITLKCSADEEDGEIDFLTTNEESDDPLFSPLIFPFSSVVMDKPVFISKSDSYSVSEKAFHSDENESFFELKNETSVENKTFNSPLSFLSDQQLKSNFSTLENSLLREHRHSDLSTLENSLLEKQEPSDLSVLENFALKEVKAEEETEILLKKETPLMPKKIGNDSIKLKELYKEPFIEEKENKFEKEKAPISFATKNFYEDKIETSSGEKKNKIIQKEASLFHTPADENFTTSPVLEEKGELLFFPESITDDEESFKNGKDSTPSFLIQNKSDNVPLTFEKLSLTPSGSPVTSNPEVPLLSQQMGVQIKQGIQNGISHLEFELTPDELGRIFVKLEIDTHGRVTALVETEKRETYDLLKQDHPTRDVILQAFEDAGLLSDEKSLSFTHQEAFSKHSHDRKDLIQLQENFLNNEVVIDPLSRGRVDSSRMYDVLA